MIHPTESPGPAAADWVLVALLSALTGIVGVFGLFFLPIFRGSVPLPVAAVVVALAVALAPQVSYRLTHRMPAAMAPVLVWLAVTIGLYVTTNSLYLQVPVLWLGWQFYLLLGLGVLAAAVSIGLLWGQHLRVQLVGRR